MGYVGANTATNAMLLIINFFMKFKACEIEVMADTVKVTKILIGMG